MLHPKRLSIACAIALLLLGTVSRADDKEPTDDSAGGLAIVDTPNVSIVVKNVSQEDDSGDSQFGIGLDWRYSFEKQFPPAGTPDSFEHCEDTWASSLAFNGSLSGKGFTSLGDPQTSRSEAKDASNFNSITNRFRYAGFFRSVPPCQRLEPPPDESTPNLRAAMIAWKERTRRALRAQVERDAEGYSAVDFGFHAESESNQTFADTQVALGGSSTLASGLVSNYLLYPLKYLVPKRDEFGDVVQSPQLFVGIEEVVGASQRKKIDGADDEHFTRFRLELGWTSELLVSGLYPFVAYHHYQELDPEPAIRRADKDTADFYEIGANYYVGHRIDALRKLFGEGGAASAVRNAKGFTGIFSQGEGPFVTVRYAAGKLPPYLESDHQASVGLGITF